MIRATGDKYRAIIRRIKKICELILSLFISVSTMWILRQIKDFFTPKTILVLLALLLFRSVLYEPFIIPSGSMKSTLLVGDYVVTSKYAYGYSRFSFPFAPRFVDYLIQDKTRLFYKMPERGDIAVFRNPHKEHINYIKRIIGLPGDRVQVISGDVFLNGESISVEEDGVFIDSDGTPIHRYRESIKNGDMSVSYEVLKQSTEGSVNNTGIYVVPEDHFFVMGDNRDNSHDSRFLSDMGFIPAKHLVGRAEMILLSVGGPSVKFLPFSIRFKRIGRKISPRNN